MKIIEGDLLKIEHGYILHQVNCVGATGGLAGALRRMWPAAFESYRNACIIYGGYQQALLGSFRYSWEAEPKIVHIFGQVYPGPNTDYAAAEKAISGFANELTIMHSKSEVYVPYGMGCGLGGGDWSIYSKIIERHLPEAVIVRLSRR